MANYKELIARKRKEMESKKSFGVVTKKPKQGKTKYRILPSWREQNEFEVENDLPAPFWHDFGLHWIKTSKGGKPVAVHMCEEKTNGEACEICAAIDQAMIHTGSQEEKEILKECRSRQVYLLNVVETGGGKVSEPFVLEVTSTVFDGIFEIMEEYGDITDLEEGVDIIINRSGTGLDTDYKVTPAAKSASLDKDILKKLTNLDAAVDQHNQTKHQASLNAIGSIIGIMPPQGGQIAPSNQKRLAGQPRSKLADDAEAEDAEFDDAPFDEDVPDFDEDVKSQAKEAGLSDEDLDELDELDDLDDVI